MFSGCEVDKTTSARDWTDALTAISFPLQHSRLQHLGNSDITTYSIGIKSTNQFDNTIEKIEEGSQEKRICFMNVLNWYIPIHGISYPNVQKRTNDNSNHSVSTSERMYVRAKNKKKERNWPRVRSSIINSPLFVRE